jgi:hypothetical protein
MEEANIVPTSMKTPVSFQGFFLPPASSAK